MIDKKKLLTGLSSLVPCVSFELKEPYIMNGTVTNVKDMIWFYIYDTEINNDR